MPRRSRALATRCTRAAKRVRFRCIRSTLASVFFTVLRVNRPGPRSVFFAFRDAPERRTALRQPRGGLGGYRLFGLDEVLARGARVRHNLEREGPSPVWARAAAKVANKVVYGLGGYGGDFASVLASLRQANATDVIFSTVDTVGIPLILLKRAGLVRSPIVYTAIGLPERL